MNDLKRGIVLYSIKFYHNYPQRVHPSDFKNFITEEYLEDSVSVKRKKILTNLLD